MDVIWHRLAMNFTRLPDTNDSIGTRVASKIRRKRPRGCALGRNFVETAIGIGLAQLPSWSSGGWFQQESSI
jgi:hypothetical protein